MIMTFGMLVTSARARSMTRWKQVWMWRRQRALNVWRWGRMLWSWYAETSDSVWIHAYDVGLGTGISAFPYYIIMLILTFISMLDPPEPLQRDRNCRCQALNQLELEQELTRSQQKVGKPHSWRQPKGSGLIWSHALHTSLLNFAGKRSRLSFPIFRTRLWSLSSSWLWKGNAAAIQSWLGRRIKCGSRFCTLVKDDCSRLVSFRSFRQDKVSSGIILAIWFALMCNHRESKSI